MRRAYVATTHAYGEAIETPPRHRANPPDAGGDDWKIHESKYSDQGVRLIWTCEVFEHVARPPSKFHPHAGKKKPVKKAKPKPAKKPVAKKAPSAPAAKHAFAFAPKERKAPRPNQAKPETRPQTQPEVPAAGK